MEKNEYFVITRSEDGEVSVTPTTEKKLLKAFDDGWYENSNILDYFPEDRNPQYWTGSHVVLIIKGEIVVPKAKEKVIKYEL